MDSYGCCEAILKLGRVFCVAYQMVCFSYDLTELDLNIFNNENCLIAFTGVVWLMKLRG